MALDLGNFLPSEIGVFESLLCVAHGVDSLASGQRDLARQHFQNCVDLKYFDWWAFYWSRAFLARMAREPVWLPWLPNATD